MLTRSRPVLDPGRTCWTVAPVAASGLLIDGRDYFEAFARAARLARRFILLAGWQFDSGVSLLRGADRARFEGDVRFLPFLRDLCRRNPALRIYLLCWDYSPAYLLQREWFQELVFNRRDLPGLQFRFDDRHAIGASHHQKFAVIDGALGFVGSMDLCHERWDTRSHPVPSPQRCEPNGEDHYGPYHEVQAFLTGPAVSELVELFEARWLSSGGRDLELVPGPETMPLPFRPGVRIDAREVGFSRTMSRTLVPRQPPIREIERLYAAALESAERVLYIENQYLGSRAVFDALVRRMSDPARPRLQIAMVYPKELHSLTEELSMGSSQSSMFRHLKEVAAARGHGLGIYYSVTRGPDGRERARYIHSKVIVVDDRLLTVGSANTNNRSMGLDTELNVTWERASEEDAALAASLRRARLSLLAEHAGVSDRAGLRRLREEARLVETLDALAADPRSTLRVHPMSSRLANVLTFDPGHAILEEEVFERIAPSKKEMIHLAIRRLRRAFTRRWRRRVSVAVNPPAALARPPNLAWTLLAQALRRASGPLLLLLLAFLAGWGISVLLRLLGA